MQVPKFPPSNQAHKPCIKRRIHHQVTSEGAYSVLSQLGRAVWKSLPLHKLGDLIRVDCECRRKKALARQKNG